VGPSAAAVLRRPRQVLLIKEWSPAGATRRFLLAPLISVTLALVAWAVMPFARLGGLNINVGDPLPFAVLLASGVLRHHHGRLGVQLEVPVPGLAALGGADGQLRGLHRLRDHHRDPAGRHHEPHEIVETQAGWFWNWNMSSAAALRTCR
jgi:hypothetical protein